MFKLVLEKAKEPEIKLPTFSGSWKKQESSRKTSISALLTTLNPVTVWITANCGKFLKRWEGQTTLPASWDICIQVKKQLAQRDMKQTGYKLGKEYVKAACCHPDCLTYMRCTLCEMAGWMEHKLESRLPEQIWITSGKQIIPPLWQKMKKN